MAPQYEVGYWNIRGLAAPLRMMAAYAGVEIDDKQYELLPKEGGGWDPSAWTSVKPGLKEANAMINLPYVIDKSTGLVVTQSNACFTYLGRKFGLMGTTEEEVARVDQMLAQVFDLRNDTVKLVYPQNGGFTSETYPEACAKHFSSSLKVNLTKCGGFLGDRKYTIGDMPTAGDFHLFEMLDQHCLMAADQKMPSPLDDFPKLADFYKRFRELPQLQGYFSSDAYKLPCNNKMAHFK